MDKNMEEKIITVANYIVDNNATIIQTAEHFNMSPSSIKKYINSKDKLQSIDIELFKKVKEAQMGITLDGQIKGGKTGSTKGNSYLGKEKVLYLIDEMLDKDLTYEEAEKMFGVPSSTIYDGVKRFADKERLSRLEDMYAKHRIQNSKEENIKNVKDNDVKAVISSNMSIGVNVFFNTLKKLTPILNDFDIEIIEAHHNQKKDAPSGTAMTAFEVIANELDRDPEEVGVYGRQGMVGKRTKEEIGLHAIRGGDIVGDHTVMFIGDGERIEFTHRAHTREVFIAGVIRAIRYIPDAESGIVSSMNDVLGLE